MASLLDRFKTTAKSTAKTAYKGFKNLFDEDDDAARQEGFRSQTSTRSIVNLPEPKPPEPQKERPVLDVAKKAGKFVSQAVFPETTENLKQAFGPSSTWKEAGTGAAKAIVNAPKELLVRAPARAVVGALKDERLHRAAAEKAEVLNPFLATGIRRLSPVFQAEGKALERIPVASKFVLGKEPVQTISEQGEEFRTLSEQLAKTQSPKLPEFVRAPFERGAGSLGFVAGSVLAGSDLFDPLGGGAKKVAKEAAERAVKEAAERGAKEVAGEVVERTAKNLVPPPASVGPVVREAGEQTLYHGTKAENVDSILKEGFRPGTKNFKGTGVYFAPDEAGARQYGGDVIEAKLKPDAKIAVYKDRIDLIDDLSKHDPSPGTDMQKRVDALAKDRGYDAIQVEGEGTYTVINPSAIRETKRAVPKAAEEGLTVYHTTNAANKNAILREGFKPGSALSEDAFRGGGHGQMQDSISFSETPNNAIRFGISNNNTLFETKLKPGIKVIDRPEVEFAEDLNDEIQALRKQGVDAVRIGSGEDEIVVINPEAIDRVIKTTDFRGTEAAQLRKTYKPGVAGADEALGAAVGLQPEYDEQGNIKGFKYDPALGIAGFAGLSLSKTKMGKQAIKQLKQAKDEYLQRFLATTEEGAQVLDRFYVDRDGYEQFMRSVSTQIDPSKLAQAIKNTPYYKKEKSVADWMTGAKILEKNGSYRLAVGEEADKLVRIGYRESGNVDSIVSAANADDGEAFLQEFLNRYENRLPTSELAYADRILQGMDPNYKALNDAIGKQDIDISGEVFKAEGLPPTPEELTSAFDAYGVPTLKSPPKTTLVKSGFPRDIIDEESAQAYAKHMTELRDKARGTKPSSNVLSELKKKMMDSFSPIEDALTEAEKKAGIKVLPKHDVRLQLDRVVRAPTLAGQFIKDNGLEEVVQAMGTKDLDVFDQYLTARHAIDLQELGIETGRDIAKDKQLVDVLASRFEPFAEQVTNYSRKLLDYSVDSGLISRELADELKIKYPRYVPMQRIFDVLENVDTSVPTTKQAAHLNRQTVVQKIIGSEREIESPLGSLITKTNGALIEGERNRAARMLASYATIPDFPMRELKAGESAPFTVSFLDNGVKKNYATTKEIADSAKSMNISDIGLIGSVLNTPIRVFKAGTTGLNPSFTLANLGKDQITALVNTGFTREGMDPRHFFRALFSSIKHDDLYDELIRQGGLSTSFDVARNQPVQTLKRIHAGRNPLSQAWYTIKHPSELLRGVENVFARTEELTRIQQFKASLEQNLKAGRALEDAKLLAAQAARDNTANFARRGEWGRTIGALFPYVNAGIQGTRSSLRAAQRNPALYAAKATTLVFTPVAVATAWNMRDPKRQEIYRDIQDFEKENNIIIVPPGAEKDAQGRWNVWKIPLPPGLNALVNPIRLGIERAYGGRDVRLADGVDAALGFVSPINISVADEKGFSGKEAARTVASSVVPKIIQPPLENYTNKRFFAGTPIVPRSLERLSPELQTRPNTSGILQKTGEALGVSPLKLENLVTGYTGGAGAVALHYADQLAAKTGLIPEEQVSGNGVVEDITRRYQKARGGKVLDQDYEAKATIDQEKADLSYKTKQEAEAVFKSLGGMAPEARAQTVIDLQKTKPEVVEKLKDIMKDAALGLNERQRLIKGMTEGDGQRASYILDRYLPSIPAKERGAAMQELVAKKVVTKKVLIQILEKMGNRALKEQLEKLPESQPTSTKPMPVSRVPVGKSLVVAKRNPSKVIAGYDFTTYATDPKWGTSVRGILSNMPKLESADDITRYIRSHAPKSPISGGMVLASAEKFGVDPQVLLAIAKQEAQFATKGRAAWTYNPGNVGNVDSGANVNWGSWQAGMDALARNVARRKIG